MQYISHNIVHNQNHIFHYLKYLVPFFLFLRLFVTEMEPLIWDFNLD